jgi:maltose operon protein
MDKFSFETLQIGDAKSFDLNERSPAYQFLTGKSYFKAFLLPQSSYPYVVAVTSYMLGENVDAAYIFPPHVITLSENYELMRSTDPQNFKLSKAGFFETVKETWGLMYKLEGEIPFTENNKTEKYLIVLTTDELLRAKTSLSTFRTVPIVLPGVVGAVPVGIKEVLIPHSPTGRIKISLRRNVKGVTP